MKRTFYVRKILKKIIVYIKIYLQYEEEEKMHNIQQQQKNSTTLLYHSVVGNEIK